MPAYNDTGVAPQETILNSLGPGDTANRSRVADDIGFTFSSAMATLKANGQADYWIEGTGPLKKIVVEFDGAEFDYTDDGTAGGYATVQIGTFDAGDAVTDVAYLYATEADTTAADGGNNDLSMRLGVGSTAIAAAAESLGTTENDVMDSTTFTAGGSAAGEVQTSGVTLTGNSTAGDPAELHFNIAATAATSEASGTITLTANMFVCFLLTGDY